MDTVFFLELPEAVPDLGFRDLAALRGFRDDLSDQAVVIIARLAPIVSRSYFLFHFSWHLLEPGGFGNICVQNAFCHKRGVFAVVDIDRIHVVVCRRNFVDPGSFRIILLVPLQKIVLPRFFNRGLFDLHGVPVWEQDYDVRVQFHAPVIYFISGFLDLVPQHRKRAVR